MPKRHVGLIGQVIAAAIGAVIVHDQEMIDPHVAVVIHEIGQADMFVPQGRKQQDVPGFDLCRTVHHGAQ